MVMVRPRPRGSGHKEAADLVRPAFQKPAKRRELSGPALRTFTGIAEALDLNEAERLRLIGSPARSTYYGWLDKARRGEAVTLPLDALLRLSLLFGIWKALRIVFTDDETALRWMRSDNSGPLFGGQAPLTLMTNGTQEGLFLLRRHLDAWRGGMFAAPEAGEPAEAPLTDADLEIV